jgi:hypothetical protein
LKRLLKSSADVVKIHPAYPAASAIQEMPPAVVEHTAQNHRDTALSERRSHRVKQPVEGRNSSNPV